MENNKSKSFEFTNGQISEIECVLVKAIETFHESNITYSITQMGAFFNFFFVFLLIDYYFIFCYNVVQRLYFTDMQGGTR